VCPQLSYFCLCCAHRSRGIDLDNLFQLLDFAVFASLLYYGEVCFLDVLDNFAALVRGSTALEKSGTWLRSYRAAFNERHEAAQLSSSKRRVACGCAAIKKHGGL
jgi:hypothetical protein